MKRLRERLIGPWVWLVLLIVAAGAGGYVLFGVGGLGGNPQTRERPLAATADIAAEAQPVQPFAALDPALAEALLNDTPLQPRNIRPDEVPPIGLYLPAANPEGLTFELRADPALAPPANLENALLDANGLPITSESVGAVELLEYAGDGCAPAGLPVSGVLTQRYHAYHVGIDIGVPLGTPTQATHSGVVIFAGWSSYGYGYLVIVQNGRFITYYAHLTNFNVQIGDEVGAGSVIGWSGSTGNSTGPHVHYETRIDDSPIDPLTFEQRGFGTC